MSRLRLPDPVVYVTCHRCGVQLDERKVKLDDIEENLLGQDLVTFDCPNCKKTVKSLRILK